MANAILINAILIGFGLIAFGIGVALYVVQFRQGLRANASKKWPTTTAMITASALEPSAENRRRFRAAIEYSYRVGANAYRSDRVFWGGSAGREKPMRSVVNSYPAGTRVRIHYDPRNPAEAVLDPDQNTGSRILVMYAMAMMTLGLFAFTGGVVSLVH